MSLRASPVGWVRTFVILKQAYSAIYELVSNYTFMYYTKTAYDKYVGSSPSKHLT